MQRIVKLSEANESSRSEQKKKCLNWTWTVCVQEKNKHNEKAHRERRKRKKWKLLWGECVQFMSAFFCCLAMCPKYTTYTSTLWARYFHSRRIFEAILHPVHRIEMVWCSEHIRLIDLNCNKWSQNVAHHAVSLAALESLESRRWCIRTLSASAEIRFYDKLMKHPAQHHKQICAREKSANMFETRNSAKKMFIWSQSHHRKYLHLLAECSARSFSLRFDCVLVGCVVHVTRYCCKR